MTASYLSYDAFICYSPKDIDFVRKLYEALGERRKKAWVDWKDILPTTKWLAEVYAGIESADSFVFVISPDSVTSENCARELAHALENNKRIVPILYRDVENLETVPPDIQIHQYIFVRKSDNEALEKLIQALDIDVDWVHSHTRLLIRAKEWEREGRDSSFLLRGKLLVEAEKLLVDQLEKEPILTQLQKEYIKASRKAQTKPQERSPEEPDPLTPETLFISYSHKDWDRFVKPRIIQLREAGFKVWLDKSHVAGGARWTAAIEEALNKCERMVLFVSPDAVDSKWVRNEIIQFLNQDKNITPLMCRHADLPFGLLDLNALQYEDYAGLLRTLRSSPWTVR